MSLRKRCSPNEPPQLSDGTPNPLHCPTSPRCDRHWHFYFCLNRRRYRNTTETSDKHLATSIEAKERTRVLELRHGIRRQPDITFKQFATTYLHDYADVEKRSADRYREILKSLNRAFGSVLLHELTEHRIQQWKRERLAGKWRGYKSKSAPKPLKPATVNRELDTLKSILAKLVEWKKLVESPARNVRRFKVDNRRTRILTPDEQRRLLEVSPRKLRTLIAMALITSARAGELLGLKWQDVKDDHLAFLQTKNGKVRPVPLTDAAKAVLAALPRRYEYVWTNNRTEDRYTVNGVAHVFRRAVNRAGISTGDVTLHTLRHTAISRMGPPESMTSRSCRSQGTVQPACLSDTRTPPRRGNSTRWSRSACLRWSPTGTTGRGRRRPVEGAA